MFNTFINNISKSSGKPQSSVVVSVYPISEYNLAGIKILYDNSKRMGGDNINVESALVSPSLWMGDFLNKYWENISYVSSTPIFDMLKIVGDEIHSCNYKCDSISLSEDELDKFFKDNKWKKFVLFYVCKVVDLTTLKVSYMIRYADVTEKYEVRDNKINDVLSGVDTSGCVGRDGVS